MDSVSKQNGALSMTNGGVLVNEMDLMTEAFKVCSSDSKFDDHDPTVRS